MSLHNDDPQPLKTEQIKDKDRIFEFDTYNGITVVIDKSTGYYNAGKICRDNKKLFKDLTKQKRYNEYVKALSRFGVENYPPPLTYELDATFSNETRGTYIHPKLVNFVCEWVSLEYCIRVGEIMDLVNEQLHQENISLKQYIQLLEQKNKEMQAGRKIIKGEIRIEQVKIPKTKEFYFSRYHIKYSQFITKNQPFFKKFETYNAKLVFDIFRSYAALNCIKGVKLLPKNEIVGSSEAILSALDSIANNKFSASDMISEFRLKMYEILNKMKLNYNKLGLGFELYCSELDNIPMYRVSSTDGIGLNKKDVGCDLLDINRHICAQCKCFTHQLEFAKLQTFLDFIEFIKSDCTEEDWEFRLYVLEQTQIYPDTMEKLNEYNIIVKRIKYNYENIDINDYQEVQQFLINNVEYVLKNERITQHELYQKFQQDYPESELKEQFFQIQLKRFSNIEKVFFNNTTYWAVKLNEDFINECKTKQESFTIPVKINPYEKFIEDNAQYIYNEDLQHHSHNLTAEAVSKMFEEYCQKNNFEEYIMDKRQLAVKFKPYLEKGTRIDNGVANSCIYHLVPEYQTKLIKEGIIKQIDTNIYVKFVEENIDYFKYNNCLDLRFKLEKSVILTKLSAYLKENGHIIPTNLAEYFEEKTKDLISLVKIARCSTKISYYLLKDSTMNETPFYDEFIKKYYKEINAKKQPTQIFKLFQEYCKVNGAEVPPDNGVTEFSRRFKPYFITASAKPKYYKLTEKSLNLIKEIN